ncbi:2Fe-2S iron-sulfur cluster binding domain-containing protein [Nocardia beijingensis]|uniref:2Fe-2S iron-sulfur cluster-binding protein n=1 Tax=Nocardia beijingensis TaxID=95162 RepID=UPI0018931B6E|nr:2Fe-2S iron-sulfur cluster-binding protein [Nocardia beijingensis]MBF6465939.1 2Fe-2S iron-sulfur cluster binding domain-containing protein [Nocardia beijingensis]
MRHPLATRFDGAAEILAQIADRVPDTRDHLAETRATIDAYHPERLRLAVTDIIDETASTKTIRLEGFDKIQLPPFLAGQYVNVFIDGTSRPYAISSSPARLTHYDLTVRRVRGGRVSNLLLDTVRIGQVLTTTGPMGTFHHNPLFHGTDVVFLAGGSGVAPAMSMIREITELGLDRTFHLVYGSRDATDIIFGPELDEIAAAHPGIDVDHVIAEPGTGWTGATGLLTADTIARLAGELDGRMVYVCGPQALYPYALEQLTALGHPRKRIRFEANGAPTDPTVQSHWPTDIDPAAEVTVTAGSVSFRTPRNRPLLDALEDNGIRPEAACRSGECSLCRVRILKGEVHTAEEAKLRLSDTQFGYTHSCVAYPISDVELGL